MLNEKRFVKMNQHAIIITTPVKIMDLVLCYKEQRIVDDLVFFKIDIVFSFPALKPNDLIKAVGVCMTGLAIVVDQILPQIKKDKLQLFRLMTVEMVFH